VPSARTAVAARAVFVFMDDSTGFLDEQSYANGRAGENRGIKLGLHIGLRASFDCEQ
jgi:hypothetical protein